MHFAEQELELKKKIMERLETTDKDHKETMNSLAMNFKSLNDTMANVMPFSKYPPLFPDSEVLVFLSHFHRISVNEWPKQ